MRMAPLIATPIGVALMSFLFFVGSNVILEIDKGERTPFPYKKGPIPFDLEEKKKNHGSPLSKSGRLDDS